MHKNWSTLHTLPILLIVDETLELLHTSSRSRGLPHQLTKNIWKLMVSEERKQWQIELSYPVWNSKLDAASALKQAKRMEKAREKAKESQAFAQKGMAALTEVIAMAEARDGVSLGRVMLKRKVRKL